MLLFLNVQKKISSNQNSTKSVLFIRTQKIHSNIKVLSICQNYSYLHHSDCWVNLGRQRNMNLIFVSVNTERENVL